MIRKRNPEPDNKPVEPIKTTAKPVEKIGNDTVNKNKRKTFRTYKEEACYVLDLLEKSGVNIYEEGRSGGMYLKRKGSAKLSHIFTEETNNNKSQENQTINNTDLSNFFNNK